MGKFNLIRLKDCTVNGYKSSGTMIITREQIDVTTSESPYHKQMDGKKEWGGNIVVPINLYTDHYENWGGREVNFMGYFSYEGEEIGGAGRAIIDSVQPHDIGQVLIHVEGKGRPYLDKEID